MDTRGSILGEIRHFLKKNLPPPLKRLVRCVLAVPGRTYADIRAKPLIRYLKETPEIKRIFLFFTPEHGNVGDHAIVLAEEEFLKKRFPDWQVVTVPQTQDRPVARCASAAAVHRDNAVVTVPGGGFLGNLWIPPEYFTKNIFGRFANNRIVFFPNTIFFERTKKVQEEISQVRTDFLSHGDCHVFIRDKSIDFLRREIVGETFSRAYSCPDIALSMDCSRHSHERDGVLFCFRSDKERIQDKGAVAALQEMLRDKKVDIKVTDTVQPYNIVPQARRFEVERKLEEFQRSRLVITDRLHGMIFSAITGTPCIAMNNSSGKVEGVHALWLADLPYVRFAKDFDEAAASIDAMLAMGGHRYNPSVFEEHWRKLADVISGKSDTSQ